ncbi:MULTISPECIES: hypothetical protein [unclassified Nocardioides]|uniref:hypothetical protein n=1 Tax=unclassified Nocardioides TaxID=2615069 RepID=UPI00070329FA|nr:MULTISPECIES: hypothetical protein [unclassified Nocardioides]KRC52902.1 hypothetical protein ASE19_10875 [Nocardioides sp. Root79]KRC72432.1 hypothetical protein ASE20_07410 [Nocardioides sp. Root240]
MTYANETGGTGDEPTGAVTVTVDATDRVRQVEVRERDSVHDPAALAAAVEHAYRAAVMDRLEALYPDRGLDPDRRIAGLDGHPPIRTVENRQGQHVARPRAPRSTALLERRFSPTEGISANECVTVTLALASSWGPVVADPGWLANARPSNVGDAITQAFADAYRKRDER